MAGIDIAVVVSAMLAIAALQERRDPKPAVLVPEMHAGAMAPIGIGALAALVGMFVVVDAAGGDRRLRLGGYRTSVVLTARLGVDGQASLARPRS